ncbi:MAG: hypothetical protein PHX61_15015 [Alphaproteobacteria bacterium]|nr:hypothetical protein [Alphaproteobacteria bacterium]
MSETGIISATTLAPITEAVTSNIGVILPVGVAIFAILLGLSFIPKIIKLFRK